MAVKRNFWMLLLVFRSHLRHLQSQCEPIVIVAFSMISFRSGNAKVVISSDLERRRDRKRMARHVRHEWHSVRGGRRSRGNVVGQIQCDQIGRFMSTFVDKLSYNSSPNGWRLFGLLRKHRFSSKKCRGYFGATFLRIRATFYFSIWSHCWPWSSTVVKDEDCIGAQVVSCCVYGKTPKITQDMHGINLNLLDCWANPINHSILLKGSMGSIFTTPASKSSVNTLAISERCQWYIFQQIFGNLFC